MVNTPNSTNKKHNNETQHQQQSERGRKMDSRNCFANNVRRDTSPLSTCVSSVVPFKEVFELTRQIDSGSYSVVCEAIHRISNEKYAVKIYDRTKFPSVEEDLAVYNEVSNLRYLERRRYAQDLFKERKQQQRVQQQQQAAAAAMAVANNNNCSSEHNNNTNNSIRKRRYDIVRLIDFFEDTKAFYLVLELCTGGDVFTRVVERHFYSEYEARFLAKCLLESVKYMHECGIAHRDLKPDNLLLAKRGNDVHVKIADFGFSAKTRIGGMQVNLTQRCGTPAYVAPEVLRGGPYDERVDMWSVGAILYFVLGGYPAFVDDKPKALFNKILKADYEFHEEDWCHVTEDAKSLVRSLLTLDVNRRLTAAEALKHPWIRPRGSMSNSCSSSSGSSRQRSSMQNAANVVAQQQQQQGISLQKPQKVGAGQSSSEC